MRLGRLFSVLAVATVAACGGDAPGGSESTSTERPTDTFLPPVSTEPATAPVATTPTMSSTPTVANGLPASWLRYGAEGLFLVDADGEQQLVDRPIGWAASDGAGGVLFTDWNPDRFGPTWWLPGGSREAVVVSEWDNPLFAAVVDGRPAVVGAVPDTECPSDGGVHMVARTLVDGQTALMQCGVGGQDVGLEPDSFGGGTYVGVEWDAVHSSGRSTDIRIVFRDAAGNVIDLPTNPYADDCSPCELTAALSPDGSRLAVVHRPDAPPFRPDEYESWRASTAAVEAELRLFDLATGELSFSRSLPAGARPVSGSWFDGRFVVIGPDAVEYPWLALGDRGDAVRTVQRFLVERGADIETDGIFGPGTQAAVEAFHVSRFGRARSIVGADTWAELGVTDTVIDTETGITTQLPSRVVVEVILTDVPPPGVTWSPAEIDEANSGATADADTDVAILRPDGLGPFTFGADADDVQSWLLGQLGEPDASVVESGQGGWPLMSCTERRFSYWADAGFVVGFTDLNGYDTTGTVADCDGAPHLAGWYVAAEGPPWFARGHGEMVTPALDRLLTTAGGVGLGATAGDLRTTEPDTSFGEWDIDEYAPATFRTSSGMWGRVAWAPVADVQRALNELGAALAVDDTFGPRTQAALAEFQASNDIGELGLGPRTLDALDVEAPDDAPIVYVAAGTWDWSF